MKIAQQDFGSALSADGQTFAFVSSSALVPQDVNEGPDVYVWEKGHIGLITSGTTRYARQQRPYVVGVSPDGRDVVFAANERLTAGVGGGGQPARQLYDARIEGGFEEPPVANFCGGDECQGTMPLPPARLGISSAPSRASKVRNRHSSHLIKMLRPTAGDGSVAHVRLRALQSGSLRVSGPEVRSEVRTGIRQGATVVVAMRLTPKARLVLEAKGTLRVAVAVRFTARGGEMASRQVRLFYGAQGRSSDGKAGS